MEGLTLFKIMGSKKCEAVSNAFWEKLVINNRLPERSADQLRRFWQKHQNKTQEVFLCESILNKIDFCLSFSEIPNKMELETKLREMHSEVFDHLEQDKDPYSHDEEATKVQRSDLLFSGSTQVSQPASTATVEEFKVNDRVIKMKVVQKIQP